MCAILENLAQLRMSATNSADSKNLAGKIVEAQRGDLGYPNTC